MVELVVEIGKLMEYQILEAGDPEKLESYVNRAIAEEDWKPQGGVAIMPLGDDQYIYAQALVRRGD